jgi:hypothetical protein
MKLKDYDNILELYEYIITLQFDKKTLILLINKIVLSGAYLFLKHGRYIMTHFLEKMYNEPINDEYILTKIKTCELEEQFSCILYLLLPKMFYEIDKIKVEYDRIKYNLQRLVDIKDCLQQSDNINSYYTNNFTYYYTYFGENVKELLQHFCMLMRQMFPILNYKKQFKKKKDKKKKRVGFFSNFIFKNHSVCRDRLGIIKSLCHDELYDVNTRRVLTRIGDVDDE